MQVYEVTNPSDHIEFKAADDEVAILAIIVAGRGAYGVIRVGSGETVLPVLLSGSAEAWVTERFGGVYEMWKRFGKRKADIGHAFASALVGSYSDHDLALEHMDEDNCARYLAALDEKNTTSMNRICRKMHAIGRKILAEVGA